MCYHGTSLDEFTHMNSLDVQQVFDITAKLQEQCRDICIKLDITLTGEHFDEMTELFLELLMADSDTPMYVRKMSLENAVDNWLSHLVAYRDNRRSEKYRMEMKANAMNLTYVEEYYEQRLGELKMLEIQIQQMGASSSPSFKR